jgi:ketosteroid isomerase-like protein
MPRDRLRKLTIIYPLFFIVTLFPGCNRIRSSKKATKKEIKQILFLREQAMESKDLHRYMQCISEDYEDRTETYAMIKEKMQKNFEAFERIDLTQFNQSIYQEGNRVMLVQDFELSFVMAGKRDYVRGKERIFFEKKDGTWKIVKGL